MIAQDIIEILKQGAEAWNIWRKDNPELIPDLRNKTIIGAGLNLAGINLKKSILDGTKFIAADLHNANFSETTLIGTSFNNSNLSRAVFKNSMLIRVHCWANSLQHSVFQSTTVLESSFIGSDFQHSVFSDSHFNLTDLRKVNFSQTDIKKSKFRGVNFSEALLQRAIIEDSDFSKAVLIESDFSHARFERNNIYGVSAWAIQKDNLIQKDLVISPPKEVQITVDDLEVAQFIYLMLNNEKIRNVIDIITSRAVLILGRFTPERKAVLDALKDELRRKNYLPIVFDFSNPAGKSVDETVNLLARMSRFVIADITDARSIPQELRGIVPNNPSLPVIPIIMEEQHEYGMFDFFTLFRSVLPLCRYTSTEWLLQNIVSAIIDPVEQKVEELRIK